MNRIALEKARSWRGEPLQTSPFFYPRSDQPHSYHQGGYLLILSLVMLAVLSVLGVMVGRYLLSDLRAFNEHVIGGRLYASAMAGMEAAAQGLRQSACNPAALDGAAVSGSVVTLQRYLVENGRVTGLFMNTLSPTGGGRFVVGSTGSTVPQSAHQRALSAAALCTAGGSGANLFTGSNAGKWEQGHMIASGMATFYGYDAGDATAQLAGTACSSSGSNTTCVDTRSGSTLSLPASGGRDVFFTTKFEAVPGGAFFSLRIDYRNGAGQSARVICATPEADEMDGVLLDEEGNVTCTHTPSGEVINTYYDPMQLGMQLNLGRNLDPATITFMRLRTPLLAEGEELRFQESCLGHACSLTTNPTPTVIWESGSWGEG